MSNETALATKKDLRAIMRSEETVGRFLEVMGRREAMAYISSVLLEVANTPALQDCTPQSIIIAAMKAATLGLSCARETGQAYLVPFRDHGTPKATLVVGYRGIEQLALRTGKYRYINVARVYEGQTVDEDQLTGRIAITGFRKEGGKITGYCLYFELLKGYSKAFYMSVEDLWAHAERYSKTFRSDSSLWKTETDKMMQKTVLRLGLSKYGYLDPFDRSVLEAFDESEPTSEDGYAHPAEDTTDAAPGDFRPETPDEKKQRILGELYGDPAPVKQDANALKKERAALQKKDANGGLSAAEIERLKEIDAALKPV